MLCFVFAIIFTLSACNTTTIENVETTTVLPEITETTTGTSFRGMNANIYSIPVDIDLTELSVTIAYATVTDMCENPQNYENKTVRITGSFSVFDNGDRLIFSCLMMDATACCYQGLEFIRNGDFAYPDDYPNQGECITVVGTFHSYDEDGVTYAELLSAEVGL